MRTFRLIGAVAAFLDVLGITIIVFWLVVASRASDANCGHLKNVFDPKEGSNLDRATDLAYKCYTGELPMPRDFFENLCTDNATDRYYREHPKK